MTGACVGCTTCAAAGLGFDLTVGVSSREGEDFGGVTATSSNSESCNILTDGGNSSTSSVCGENFVSVKFKRSTLNRTDYCLTKQWESPY